MIIISTLAYQTLIYYLITLILKLKIQLYILSLWLLFLLIIVNRFKVTICFDGCAFEGFGKLIIDNIIPVIAFILFALGIIFYLRFRYLISGAKKLPVQIKKIENVNYEHLTFLTTYIIPLICFDLSQYTYALDLAILLVIIGAIYIKTNLFYANPTLALLGYQIYKVNTVENDNLIFISREKLKVEDWVELLSLDESIYFVKLK